MIARPRCSLLVAALVGLSLGCAWLHPEPPAPALFVDEVEVDCEVTETRDVDGGGLIECRLRQDDGGAGQAPRQDCAEIVAVVKTRELPAGVCLPSCDDCNLDPRTVIALHRRLSALCDRTCRANGSCGDGQQCVIDRLENQTTVSTCFQPSRACDDEDLPARCFSLNRVAECKCKCVPADSGDSGSSGD